MYSDTPSDEPFLDTVQGEVVLFHAIARARPIGINRHFHVMAIWLAIQKETQQRISIDEIWSKLRTLYDIDALNAIVSAALPLYMCGTDDAPGCRSSPLRTAILHILDARANTHAYNIRGPI